MEAFRGSPKGKGGETETGRRYLALYTVFGIAFLGCFTFFNGVFFGDRWAAARFAAKDEAVLARGRSRTESSGGGFMLRDGRKYPAPLGEVVYATADPMIREDLVPSLPVEWGMLGATALLGLTALRFAHRTRGTKASLATCGLFAVGAWAGSVATPRIATYTLQVADYVVSGPMLRWPRDPAVQVSRIGLYVEGKPIGRLRNHAHVWVRPDGVYVDGKLVVRR